MPDPDWRSRAEYLLRLDRPAEAVQELGPGLAQEPDDPAGLAMLSFARLALDQHHEGLVVADRLVALTPDDVAGHRLRAQALTGLRRRHEAVAAAAEAVRLDPLDSASHVRLALVAVHIPERRRDALAAARRAAELAPQDPDAHFAVGIAAEALRMVILSDAAYAHTLGLDPTHAGALINRANNQGFRLRRRMRGYAAALRSRPDLQIARFNLEGLLLSTAIRFYLAAFVALLVSFGVAYSGGSSRTRALVGSVLLALLLALLAILVRQVPDGLRAFVRGQVTHNLRLTATLFLTALLLLALAWTAFLTIPGWFADVVLRPLGVLFTGLVVVLLGSARVDD